MAQIMARQYLDDAKQVAVKMRGTFSPIKKGELAEEFLMFMVASMEKLVEAEESRQGVSNGE